MKINVENRILYIISMEINMSTTFEKAKTLVNKLNQEERFELGKYCLDKEVMKDRFSRFLRKMQVKNIPITFDEITAEVENIRKKMYQERINK